VSDVNEKIEAFKSGLESGSVAEARADLALLEDCQTRHGEVGRDLSERLRLNRSRKKRIEEAKDEAKEELGEYQRQILSSCQEGINEFLRKAGADFRIRDAEVGYQGGTANARFSIEINREKIGLGNAVTEVGEQSFRNLLSDGDKNTLAFAFFYARIKQISDLDNRAIVIDDPISSLDEHRRGATRNAILELADRCKQIIVLSHSPRFLSNLWGESDKSINLDLFQIRKTGERTSKLMGWGEDEMMRKVQDPYFRHFERLVAYESTRQGDPVDVAHSIRHVLEGNLRRRFPDRYKRKDGSIGSFIGMVQEAEYDDPLYNLQGTDYFEELREIADSEYCHGSHHSDDPFLSEPINENQLYACVKRTIHFARGLPR
jgi:wobble nucleotide-excising tRNase